MTQKLYLMFQRSIRIKFQYLISNIEIKIWDRLNIGWNKAFYYIEQYVEREGHSGLPYRHQKDGFALGTWVSQQRTAYRKKELPPNRIERLEALKGWTWDASEARFQHGIKYIEQYVEREGHSEVAYRHLEEGFDLGFWVSQQRAAYRKKELPPNRTERLEALMGWTWDKDRSL